MTDEISKLGYGPGEVLTGQLADSAYLDAILMDEDRRLKILPAVELGRLEPQHVRLWFGDNRIYARAEDRSARDWAEWEGRWSTRLGATCDPETLKRAFDDAYAAGQQCGEQVARDEEAHERRFFGG